MTHLCHGTTDLGEEEGENKCSEEDHCYFAKEKGCRNLSVEGNEELERSMCALICGSEA